MVGCADKSFPRLFIKLQTVVYWLESTLDLPVEIGKDRNIKNMNIVDLFVDRCLGPAAVQ